MQEFEKLSDNCVRFKNVVNKMATLGEILNSEVLIKKLLWTLTPKWKHVAIIIEERKDLTTFQFDHLVGCLMSHEERLKDSFRESDVKASSSKLKIKKKMLEATPKIMKVKVEAKIRIMQKEIEVEVAQEEEVVPEDEVEVVFIREIFNVTIVKIMVTLKENVD